MIFRYTIPFVNDVATAPDFYDRAGGFRKIFLHWIAGTQCQSWKESSCMIFRWPHSVSRLGTGG